LELAIEKIIRETGAVEQEIKTLYENQRLASFIRSLQERRDDLYLKITEINSTIESLVHAQEIRKRDIALAISQATSRLLKLDLYRQEEFRSAEVVRFGFEENQVSVDGSTRFSESSTVVLRHLFHLALMTASTKIPEMRFPRFLMLDGIEDGGIEMPRAHRLQEIVAAECESYEVEFQVIMATSQIAPSLDSDRFVVGRRYTEDHRAIDFTPSEKAHVRSDIQRSQ
jgi:Zn ribbon nucleic-acid-binding protein